MRLIITPDQIDEPTRVELAALCREYRRLKEAAVGRLLGAVRDGRGFDAEERDESLREIERMDEAAERLGEWLSERDVKWPVLCDGWYYLHDCGELLVVDPDGAIDVSGKASQESQERG